MIDDTLDGPRIAELFLAEIVGRDYGSLSELSVTGLDDPVSFSCEVGERYEINRDDEAVAEASILPDAVEISGFDEGGRITIDGGSAIKPALEELLERS